jgi:hypothetical protein
MSVSDPGEKIEWGADSEPRKNERVPSSDKCTYLLYYRFSPLYLIRKIAGMIRWGYRFYYFGCIFSDFQPISSKPNS